MQNINVKVLYVNKKYKFQITLGSKKAPWEIKTSCTAFENYTMQ